MARRLAVAGLSVALITGAGAGPVFAEQGSRSTDPNVSSLQETAEDALRRTVRDAREAYATEITAARAARDERLAVPRAERSAALKTAKTKAAKRLVRREYRRVAAPVREEYRSVKQSARAERNAIINEALAAYLVATGQPGTADALEVYRDATAAAGDTLALALKSGRDTFRTDNADERAQLFSDLEEAATTAESRTAWLDYEAASAGDREAYTRSIASARATYSSAMTQARRDFKAETGLSIKKLLNLPFTI